MYSDTHFHFPMIQSRTNSTGSEILYELLNRNCFFAMDIGTKSCDLQFRKTSVEKAILCIDESLQESAKNMIHYTAGIWPTTDAIENRFEQINELEDSIKKFENNITAIGECGIDHHWNPSGEDGRNQNDFDVAMYNGERELFEMQIDIAKKMNLPVIVHSRDAFSDTIDCIKNSKYNNGIIHCYSYGIEEARSFIDLGWHISFSGSVTYTKKSKYEDMKALLSFVPCDMILCETDAPYLAPVPHRGKINTPIFVDNVYNYVAKARSITPERLSEIVDTNCKNLFNLQ